MLLSINRKSSLIMLIIVIEPVICLMELFVDLRKILDITGRTCTLLPQQKN
jgi:hypothetical protein